VGRDRHHVKKGGALDEKVAARPHNLATWGGDADIVTLHDCIVCYFRRSSRIRQNCFAAEQLPNPWEDKYDVHPSRLLIAGVAGDEDLMNS
jgi:hypothetical protein